MDLAVHTVTSLDHPSLAPYRTLRRPKEHYRDRIFVGEGEKVVRKMLEGSCTVISLLLTEEWFEHLRDDARRFRKSGGPVFIAEPDLLRQIVGHRLHQGVMAVGKIPPEPPMEEVATSDLIVALDGLSRAENVGAVVRNAAAFGAGIVLVGETSVSPWMRRAVRSSMGTVLSLGVHQSVGLHESLKYLRGKGISVIAADLAGEVELKDLSVGKPLCVLLGNEERGVSPELVAEADHRVRIPMVNGTDSLNVAAASAVFLYEVTRRKET